MSIFIKTTTGADLDRLLGQIEMPSFSRRHHRDCEAHLFFVACHRECEKDDAFRERIKEGLADG